MKIPYLKHLFAAAAALLAALAVVMPVRADYVSTVQSLNPVAYWHLDEPATVPVNYGLGTATNYGTLGTAADGTYFHSPTLQEPGVLTTDPSVQLNGTSQYIDVPYSPVLNTNGPFTVEFWANLTVVAAGAKSGVMSFKGNTGFLFYVSNNDPKWGFRLFNGTGRVYLVDNSGPDIQPYTWYHVVGVFDGEYLHIYVNGFENTEKMAMVGDYVPNPDAPLRIGAGNPAGAASLFFPGWMDEVAVYPTALSAEQIAAHYDAATANPAGYAALILADAPSGYWRFNEATLPPEPTPEIVTVTNSGSWGALANGTFDSGGMSCGVPGVPYHGFGTENTAGKFTGTSGSYIEIPPQDLYTDSWTVTCWAKRTGISEYWAMIFSNPTDVGQPVGINSAPVTGIGFGDGGNPSGTRNDLRFYWSGDLGNTGSYGATPNPGLFMPDQQWTFLALVATPTNLVMYMNGQSATNNAERGPHNFSTVPSFIGKKQQYNGWASGGEVNGFLGIIDEMAIFDKSLTGDEIRQIFAAAEVPPIILVQPTAPVGAIYEGMTVTLSMLADELSATSPLVYQWTKNGTPLEGETTTNLIFGSAATSDSGNYAMVVTNAYGALTSSVVTLTVQASAPLIVQQPKPAARYAGGTATFSIVQGGSLPITYQWSFNGTPIPGAIGPTYTVARVSAADVGNYSVKLTNVHGSLTSDNAALTLQPLAPGYAAEVVAGEPAAYWRFNETTGTTAFDYFGGYDGANIGNVTSDLDAPKSPTYVGLESTNTAYAFSGSNSEVDAPPSLDLNPSGFTIAVWMKVNVPAANMMIVNKGGSGWRLQLGSDAGTLQFITDSLSGTLQGGYNVGDTLWHHVVAVFDGSYKYIYVDGYLDISSGAGGSLAMNTNAIQIGAQGTGNRWNGSLDEVALYNRGLSEAEVMSLYQAALTGPTAVQIAEQPVSQIVFAGQPASFSVRVQGGAPYTYQWKRAGTDIAGAVGPTLALPSAYYPDAGAYTVRVSNSVGTADSEPVTLTVLPQPLFANLTNDLVLHLKFDGDYTDSSGRGNDGTPMGTPTIVAGKIGSGALHYSSDMDTSYDPAVLTNASYVTLGSPTDLMFGADVDFTLAYWVKMPADEKYSELPVLCSSYEGTFRPGFYFGTDWMKGGYTWYLGGADAGKVFESPANLINDGDWHHLLFSFDRTGNGVTYLDGVEVDSRGVAGGGDVDIGTVINIGNDTTGTYPYFNDAGPHAEATLDDMGIWRRALSPPEAQSVYLVAQNYGRTFDTYGPVMLTIGPAVTGTGLELIWQAGTLQSADNITGPWTPVAGATAPYYVVTPTAAKKFYRVQL